MDYLFLILGFVTLIFGGEFLVKGAVGIALKAKVSTLVIGMTVVSFGTSAPELLVSINAALEGGDESLMSIGNVIGSNIANIALVLGVTALINPIPVQRATIVQDWPVMFFSTILFFVFMWDLKINRVEGIVLFLMIIIFTYYLIKKSRSSSINEPEDEEIEENKGRSIYLNILFLVLGCLGLVFGAEWLLGAAKNIAESYHVSPFIIGVTIIAFGTSVPELVTSGIAAYRKETDIALGNLIGSNIFNILCVVGLTGITAEMPLTKEVFQFDALWMIAIALLIFPFMINKKKIGRLKGVILVLFYITYTIFVIS